MVVTLPCNACGFPRFAYTGPNLTLDKLPAVMQTCAKLREGGTETETETAGARHAVTDLSNDCDWESLERSLACRGEVE